MCPTAKIEGSQGGIIFHPFLCLCEVPQYIQSVKNGLSHPVKVSILATHTGKSEETIEQDISRPRYFDPYQAVDYGLIDKVSFRRLFIAVCFRAVLFVVHWCLSLFNDILSSLFCFGHAVILEL